MSRQILSRPSSNCKGPSSAIDFLQSGLSEGSTEHRLMLCFLGNSVLLSVVLINLATAVTSQLNPCSSLARIFGTCHFYVLGLESCFQIIGIAASSSTNQIAHGRLKPAFSHFYSLRFVVRNGSNATTRDSASDLIVAFIPEHGDRDVWSSTVPLGRLARFSE